FGEKLATPDTSIADLIGEVDPIKVAEGRYLADELTIHYGLVPRTNRGIFSINELPDLAERIQVGLLNVLEERDVQIRGYKSRLPLDLMLVASANPEDYTNRGRIITPLKDRFGAQIRTHYPLDVDVEMDVVEQEARPLAAEQLAVHVPEFMAEIVAEITQQARRSPHINQRSGVSVRLAITNYETLAAHASRPASRRGEGGLGGGAGGVRGSGGRHRRARGLGGGQDRVRNARRRTRGAGPRADPKGVGARGVPCPPPPRAHGAARRRIRRRCHRAHGGGRPGVGIRDPAAEAGRGARGARRPRRGRDAGWGGVRGLGRPRRPASVEASQQGRRRRQGHLPRARLTVGGRSAPPPGSSSPIPAAD